MQKNILEIAFPFFVLSFHLYKAVLHKMAWIELCALLIKWFLWICSLRRRKKIFFWWTLLLTVNLDIFSSRYFIYCFILLNENRFTYCKSLSLNREQLVLSALRFYMDSLACCIHASKFAVFRRSKCFLYIY